MKIELQQNSFQGYRPVEIELPDDWDVKYHGCPGDEMPALTKEEIKERLEHPYGSEPLSELAKKAKRICIAFDDITRGTPTKIMAEATLEILHAAGINKNDIVFICAVGTHSANTRRDFVEKLGEDIVRNYFIYNHNCYENNDYVGKTKRGVDVYLNKEFLGCDLKIGLGAMTPHLFMAFSGGGKIISPGLASIETIAANHKTATDYINEHHLISTEMMGDLKMEGMRLEIEEITRMVDNFFKVDAIYNTKLQIVDLYAGDPIEEYYAAVPGAQRLYATERPIDRDIVIVNANAKAAEASLAAGMAAMGLNPEKGGDVVIIDHTSYGQVVHYLFGKFGHNTAGRMFGKVPRVRPQVQNIVCWMPYSEPCSAHWFGEPHKHMYVQSWQEALNFLKERHGPGTKVSVIADATIEYYTNKKEEN